MWVPKTEIEIIQAIENNSLEETNIFDAKRELSGNNIEIAKDITAMANDGGVIIYGIGEDKNGRICVRNPIPLHGQSEKINSIVRSSIQEPPKIQITTIPSDEDPSKGYVIVLIPPSDRAPHMVVVKGDNRFYGRSAKSNIVLTEGEVARLYARREIYEINVEKMLDDEVDTAPYPPNPNYGYLFLIIRPVFLADNLIGACAKNGEKILDVIKELIEQTGQTDVYPRSSIYPDWYIPQAYFTRAEGYLIELDRPNDPNSPCAPGNSLILNVQFNGIVHLFCGRIAERDNSTLLFFPKSISGNALRFLFFCSELYRRSGYIGNVDIGLAVTGIQGSIAHMPEIYNFKRYAVPYTQNSYRKIKRVSELVLREDTKSVANELINPLISALTSDLYKPYECQG